MTRLLVATGAVASLAIAACGSAAAGSSTTSSSTSSSGSSTRARNLAAGELVQLNGSNLVLNTQQGDVTVTIGSATTFSKTRTGTLADITAGSCIVATGQKDATGAISVSNVRLSAAVNGACTNGFGGPDRNGPLGGTGTQTAPRTPPPGAANFGAVRGLVTGVSGTSVTVQDVQTGKPVTITIPTTVQINVVQTGSTSDLTVGTCVAANGPRDASGTVTARSITVVPAGPSGCFTGRGFGFGGGGFGGGRFGGGQSTSGG